ncbi:hypothetical protein [Rodentibacter sp. Ppn85]|uniref:hypothetical protein n=1 Tax=Rodentibacter sp. Ppn85 TaxID=1908525 RepID=UPI000986E493|nr:hypothetical protein [Rodentibacter sp. Ppn85]OOF60355.1 hypothetical protein BKL51_11480 [Rodentibacter sp. Ppn85]
MQSIKLATLTALLATAITSPITIAHTNTSALFTPKENSVPQQLKQVDGYYRFMLGDFEVTALYDSYLNIGKEAYAQFTKLSEAELNKGLT